MVAVFLSQQPAPELGLVGINWEQNRALASLEIQSRAFPTTIDGDCQILSKFRIRNVGGLTYAIIGVEANFETRGDLTADWSRNSLLDSDLSLGLTGLQPVGPRNAHKVTFHMDDGKQTWFVVDPNRTVDISYIQPTHGTGQFFTSFMLEVQPVKFDSNATNLTVPRTVRGISRPSLPENGEGEVSDLLLYPYSAAEALVVPPGCWTEKVGPTTATQ